MPRQGAKWRLGGLPHGASRGAGADSVGGENHGGAVQPLPTGLLLIHGG